MTGQKIERILLIAGFLITLITATTQFYIFEKILANRCIKSADSATAKYSIQRERGFIG